MSARWLQINADRVGGRKETHEPLFEGLGTYDGSLGFGLMVNTLLEQGGERAEEEKGGEGPLGFAWSSDEGMARAL